MIGRFQAFFGSGRLFLFQLGDKSVRSKALYVSGIGGRLFSAFYNNYQKQKKKGRLDERAFLSADDSLLVKFYWKDDFLLCCPSDSSLLVPLQEYPRR